MLVKEILTVVKLTNRKGTLRNKTKQTKEILLFVATYNLATLNLNTGTSFNSNLIVSYRKEKSLKDILVCPKIPSVLQQSQN